MNTCKTGKTLRNAASWPLTKNVQARSLMRTAVPLMGASSVTIPSLRKAFAQASLSAMGKVLVSITMGGRRPSTRGMQAMDSVTCASAFEVDRDTINTSDRAATSAALLRLTPPARLRRAWAWGSMSEPHTS